VLSLVRSRRRLSSAPTVNVLPPSRWPKTVLRLSRPHLDSLERDGRLDGPTDRKQLAVSVIPRQVEMRSTGPASMSVRGRQHASRQK
jgi:hypothetical protein